eukprot:CAMPEP_0170454564 /NCGR_PEP_ID=MMETSP0123-20130129/2773_1 /TAXON_ID=182087 /ORGANISM="Favella ehrenbergii, Strain Fehren 1" /LENGTH=44 /DNA_ID= /DNA_START= /DNA_END= /DNA_ORIENTATION=
MANLQAELSNPYEWQQKRGGSKWRNKRHDKNKKWAQEEAPNARD